MLLQLLSHNFLEFVTGTLELSKLMLHHADPLVEPRVMQLSYRRF